jgi:hypothetical protein
MLIIFIVYFSHNNALRRMITEYIRIQVKNYEYISYEQFVDQY